MTFNRSFLKVLCGVSIRKLLSCTVLPGYYNPRRFLVPTLGFNQLCKTDHILSQREFRVANPELTQTAQ